MQFLPLTAIALSIAGLASAMPLEDGPPPPHGQGGEGNALKVYGNDGPNDGHGQEMHVKQADGNEP